MSVGAAASYSSRVRTGGRRLTALLSIAGMVMALLTVAGVGTAAAATGDPACVQATATCYPTIQGAVDAAGSGGIVSVAAGAYTENVTVSLPMTINGAQAGINANGRSGAESTVTGGFIVKASNVIIDGFTITPPAATDAVVMQGAYSNDAVKNNIITATQRAVNFNTSFSTISNNLIHMTSTSLNGI